MPSSPRCFALSVFLSLSFIYGNSAGPIGAWFFAARKKSDLQIFVSQIAQTALFDHKCSHNATEMYFRGTLISHGDITLRKVVESFNVVMWWSMSKSSAYPKWVTSLQ